MNKGQYLFHGETGTDSTLLPNASPLDDTHGMFNLATQPELYEIQRSNHFEFTVYGLDGGSGAPNSENAYALSNTESVINISVKSAKLPSYSQDPIQVARGNTTINFAGKPKYNGGNITLNDYIGAGTAEAILKWQNLSFNPSNGKVGLQKDYKKECLLTEYTPTWQKVRAWKLYGCWISNFDPGSMKYDDNNAMELTADITYDYALLESVDSPNE